MFRRSLVWLLTALAACGTALAAQAQTSAAPEPPTLQPPAALRADGMPAIPASIAAAVGAYTEFRSAWFAGWHPTKREALILTRFADTVQVHELRMPGGARRQLTFYPDAVDDASWPRRSSEYFLFTKDLGGDEFSQIYRTDVASGATTLVSDGGRSQNSLGPWSHAGDRMAFASTRRNGVDRDVYVMDPRDPSSARLLLEVKGGGWGPVSWSADDAKLAVLEYISVNETYVWIVDVATGAKTLLTPKGGKVPVAYGGAEFSRDGRGLYVTTDRDAEFMRLAYVDLASGKHRYLTTDLPWDVEEFDVAPDGRTIAFVTNEDGASVLRHVEAASGAPLPVPALPIGVVGTLAWHGSGRELGLSLSSPRAPSEMYSVDFAAQRIERWTESETGGINAAAFAEPEVVRWQSFDGRTISGLLYKPPARFAGPRPVVINIHGGPESQSRPTFLGRNNYYLDQLGVAILFPNVRGSTGFGKSFAKLDNGRLREDSVKDIGTLLDWLKSRPDLDASRVMITGGSYGGYMTLASATKFDDRIRGSLSVVGISNFVTFLENTEEYRRDLRRVEYGDERDPKMREFLLGISPMNHAQRISKPLFIVQGKNDPRVPWTESEQMVATVRSKGGQAWYLLAEDEGHGFAKKRNADYQFYATIAFMQDYLLN